MNVVDGGPDRAIIVEVAVVTWARLPKLKFSTGRFKSRWVVLPKMVSGSFRDRCLDRFQQLGKLEISLSRPDEQMDMLGHHDVSPDVYGKLIPGLGQRLEKPVANIRL